MLTPKTHRKDPASDRRISGGFQAGARSPRERCAIRSPLRRFVASAPAGEAVSTGG
jgi:hypothetical protein